MPSVLSTLAAPQTWPATIWILALTTIVIALSRLISRPAWPSKSPKLLSGWPIIGSPGFFGDRWSFVQKGISAAPSGHFGFFYGPHQIVALSGAAARDTFYTSRGLNLSEGFAALFSGAPSIEHLYNGEGTLSGYLSAQFKRFLHKDRLDANLHCLVNDCVSRYQELDISSPIDPSDKMYSLIYQLTHRLLGSNDVANDPKLLRETLAIFDSMDDSSRLEIMFPRLPIPSKLTKMWAGAKLHMAFSKIMDDRRKTGRTDDDAMQAMMDAGASNVIIAAFMMAGLFAGLINTGVQAAWILMFLSKHKDWYQKIRDQVDGAIAKHRCTDNESRVDILSRFTMQEWEEEFPLIDLCLRESIRLTMPGSAFRKNSSAGDINIAGSTEVIPKDSFAIYPIADVHLNPDIYTDPHTWDPSRYMPDRAEDKKQSHAYLGWGSGLHPCLGIRFAKLEIAISIAMFLAFFDFELVDKKGNPDNARLPTLNHGNFSSRRQPGEAFLKCERRI